LVLHREEFTWPRVSPRAPVRSYSWNLKFGIWKFNSPCGPHRFTHHLWFRFEISKSGFTGWSVFCCTCRRPVSPL